MVEIIKEMVMMKVVIFGFERMWMEKIGGRKGDKMGEEKKIG